MPRRSVLLAVAAAAVLAVGAVVGVTLATRQTPQQPRPLAGKPPVPQPLATPAAAQIRAAFATWPHGTVDTMERLAGERPRDATVQLCLGIALLYGGYDGDAESVLRSAKKLGFDTIVEVQADGLLHPQYFPGDPPFAYSGPDNLLQRGVALQSEGHQHSAERLFLQAAHLHPDDPEAQVAAAVGRFDKDSVTPAFAHLGPLTARFPKSQAVRYYLGLLLAWTAQRDKAVEQFRDTVALGPGTPLGRSAADFLKRLGQVRTAPPKK
ncbi:MAG: hypothetical protein JO186_04285 [Actinobacteria bacterium]|nr:hypothetical protein [Actinomycetota bacterium]